MKKIFTCLVVAAMSLSNVQAKLILHESFDRAVGNLHIGLNTDMGTNTEDWWSYSGDKNFIQVAEGSLAWEGFAAAKGNKAELNIFSSAADDLRQFAQVNSGKVFLAAIINVDELKSSATSDYCLSLGSATSSGMYARLYTKSVKEEREWKGFKRGVGKNNESNTYIRMTEEVFEAKKDMLVVLEYEFIDGEKNDEARLYINPTKQTSAPSIVCVQDTVSGSGAAQGANAKNDADFIASVDLRQGSNTPKIFIDEIKVATSWADLWESGTGFEEVQSDKVQSTKVIKNGVLVIKRDDKEYNAQGQLMK